jgi:hypothetical protein
MRIGAYAGRVLRFGSAAARRRNTAGAADEGEVQNED